MTGIQQKAEKLMSDIIHTICCFDWCKKCCDCCYEEQKSPLYANVKQTIHIHSNIPATVGNGPPSASSSIGSGPPSATSYKSLIDSSSSARSRMEPLFLFPKSNSEATGSLSGGRSESESSYRSRGDSMSSQVSDVPSSVQSRNNSSSSSGKSRNDSSSSFRSRLDSSSSTIYRGNRSPFIDMKPIEFFPANRENVQPKSPLYKRMGSDASFDINPENFQKELYRPSTLDTQTSLSDDRKLELFRLGEVHFSLHYDIPTKTLQVRLIEARDLPKPVEQDEAKQDMAHSNPYAKISLLPDSKESQQSSVQRKTQNPTWNETFLFSVDHKELQTGILEITVKDFDKFSRHCVIGRIHLTLSSVNLIKGDHLWKPLIPSEKNKPDLGEILLSLNYLPSAGRLNIDIIKAKQLLQTDIMGGSDPFVKVTLLTDDKTLKTKKTSFKKNTMDPVFNECISFNVSPDSITDSSVVISVWDYNSKSKDDFVGRIVLGKHATGSQENAHWSKMLQSQRSSVANWHTLKTRDDCDQLSLASAAVP